MAKVDVPAGGGMKLDKNFFLETGRHAAAPGSARRRRRLV